MVSVWNAACTSRLLSHIPGGGYLIIIFITQGGGYLTCGNCAGDGSVPVSVAQTTARNGGEETCPFCSGTGKVMCTACLVSMSTVIIFSAGSKCLHDERTRVGGITVLTWLHDTDLLRNNGFEAYVLVD